MLITLLAIIVTFGILILFHEFGHFCICKGIGVHVEEFSLGLGPKIFSFRRKETEYRLSLIPFGGYIKMAGDDFHKKLRGERWEFLSRSPRARFAVIFAGPLANFILGFLLFSLVFVIGVPALAPKVEEIVKYSPAVKAGLQAGDEILAVNKRKIMHGDELRKIVLDNPGKELKFTVKRNNQQFVLLITPDDSLVKNIFGQIEEVGIIGVTFPRELIKIKYSTGEAVRRGWTKSITLVDLSMKGLGMLFCGKISLQNLAGPIFIAQTAGQSARMGIAPLLSFVAFVSINLFLINLLPIPLFDGGHILLLAIEGVRRKPLSVRAQEKFQQIGLATIFLIALLVVRNDLIRIWHQ